MLNRFHLKEIIIAISALIVLFSVSISWALDADLSGFPAMGPENAPVKVVVFYDFQCPYCAKTAPLLVNIAKQYGDLVRYVTINVPAPGHPYAMSSAELALTADDQGKFWEAFHLIFKNQDKLSNDDLAKYGKELGIDPKTVTDNIENHAHLKSLKKGFYLAVKDLGVTSTPITFVNDQKFKGVQQADMFRWAINEELKKAGIKSPVGPVAKPAEKKSDTDVVPTDMIFPVKTEKPVDSKLVVEVGDKAPDFELPSLDGEKVKLSDFRGKKNVVLSFVPAAWTPVCSAQWPEYNEKKKVFEEADAELIGISTDNIPSLYSWTGTMGDLWFDVASDFYPHGKVANSLGVLRSNGVCERAVFIIDKKGIIRYIEVHDINSKPSFDNVKAELEKLK